MQKGKRKKKVNGAYRRDHRSQAEFAEDIALGTAAEAKIIRRYARYVDDVFGIPVKVKSSGCDNSGKYLEDDDVTTAADYRLNGRLVEVKFNNEMLDAFHFKKNQLNSYLKQGAVILWVNGWKTDNPEFTILKRRHLQRIKNTAELVSFRGWGGKKCYRLHKSDFNWFRF